MFLTKYISCYMLIMTAVYILDLIKNTLQSVLSTASTCCKKIILMMSYFRIKRRKSEIKLLKKCYMRKCEWTRDERQRNCTSLHNFIRNQIYKKISSLAYSPCTNGWWNYVHSLNCMFTCNSWFFTYISAHSDLLIHFSFPKKSLSHLWVTKDRKLSGLTFWNLHLLL